MKVLLTLVILASASVSTGTHRKVAELAKARDDETAAAPRREHSIES